MLYVHYDLESGKILGFYDDKVHNSIPIPNIKITQKNREDHLLGNLKLVKNKKITSCETDIYSIPKSSEQILEEKINNEIRAIAIERLQARGEL